MSETKKMTISMSFHEISIKNMEIPGFGLSPGSDFFDSLDFLLDVLEHPFNPLDFPENPPHFP